MAANRELGRITREWFDAASRAEYSYHFRWLGVPIIQFPQDVMAIQEILWTVKPSLVVETGIAHGGSLLLSASILELLGGHGRVVGVDVDVRDHTRKVLDEHPLAHRIIWLEGSSVDPSVVDEIRSHARAMAPVVVILDSNHSAAHVKAELAAYSDLVTPGSYLIVLDTVVEFLPDDVLGGRPWGPGNSPWTAVREFLADSAPFDVDREVSDKLQVTAAPDGYLRRRG